jgi:hypothetical protein
MMRSECTLHLNPAHWSLGMGAQLHQMPTANYRSLATPKAHATVHASARLGLSRADADQRSAEAMLSRRAIDRRGGTGAAPGHPMEPTTACPPVNCAPAQTHWLGLAMSPSRLVGVEAVQ